MWDETNEESVEEEEEETDSVVARIRKRSLEENEAAIKHSLANYEMWQEYGKTWD
jgi:hypothetical protein